MDTIQLVLFISICSLLCLITAVLMYFFPVVRTPSAFVLVLSIILIFLNPAKLNYDKEIKDAKDHYNKYKNKESYFSKQLKRVWQNALADQLIYYVIIVASIFYLLFIGYIIYLLYVPEFPVTPIFSTLFNFLPNFNINIYFPPVYLINLFAILITSIYVFIYGYTYAYLIIPIIVGLGTFTYQFLI